jgi:hypothetical protein
MPFHYSTGIDDEHFARYGENTLADSSLSSLKTAANRADYDLDLQLRQMAAKGMLKPALGCWIRCLYGSGFSGFRDNA